MSNQAGSDAGRHYADALFAGTDPTQVLLRRADWAATPLGPVEGWAEELRAAIRTVLPSRVPMLLWWGPELIQLYNDAFRPLIGTKHPDAIGQRAEECYPEAWSAMGPLAQRVLDGHGATYSTNFCLPYDRHGYMEETYWTFSYSPLRHGDVVGGILIAVLETTAQVLGERRLGLLHRLGAIGSTEAPTPAAACRAALAVLEEGRGDVPFALAHLLDEAGPTLELAASFGVDLGTVREWALVPGPDESVPSWRVAASGVGEVIVGIKAISGAVFEAAAGGDAVPDDCVLLPLVESTSSGAAVGSIALGISPYRALDDDYRAFLDLVARQVSTAVSNAIAYQAQRRRAESLAELDQAKTRLFQNVSHEFRTPLTLTLAPLRAVLQDDAVALPSGHRHDLEGAERAVLRLRRLVDGLLDFARADADQLAPHLEPTDLSVLTADVVSMFRAAIERAGLRLSVEIDALPAPVPVDREMWTKIMSNLLSNAIKFTKTGTITVGLSAREQYAALTVADTGVGIAADQLSAIFARFHQVPGVSARNDGAGIGLSLVSELVAAHAGSISVQSEREAGTTFTVTIPQHGGDHEAAAPARPEQTRDVVAPFIAEARAGPAPRPSTAPRPDETRPRILLVEDNADIGDYLTRLLEADGFAVHTVTDVSSALEHRAWPDLVLSDVMLSGADGIDLVRAIRGDPETRRVPVILLTARADPGAATEGLRAGADDYIVKPFDPAELVARVRVHHELTQLREYALSQAENRAANLELALASNRQIGAAMGILMQQHKVSADDALGMLRRASQTTNRKLRDIADDVLFTGELPR